MRPARLVVDEGVPRLRGCGMFSPSPASSPFARLQRAAALSAAFLSVALAARAEVKLPALFGDHMVLQQEATLPVWGWAEPGEKVTVTFGDKKAEATAGADGKWRCDLPAIPAGTPPGTLVVAGKNTVTIQDVLVGDVWLCSGQSNMEFHLGRDATQATDDQIRLFHVPHVLALAPRADVAAKWQICTPATAGDFTAVGYYFAKNLRGVLKRPIGLIESSVGGTGAQEWTDLPTLQGDPALKHYATMATASLAAYPGGDAEYEAKTTAADQASRDWAATVKLDKDYQAALKTWTADAAQARQEHKPAPPAPKPPLPKPAGVKPGRGSPTLLYNGMIGPLIPYAIKGTIWYQGENNAMNTATALEYGTLFPAMIKDWRAQWKQGDFPFLFVQLANFTARGADWPQLRESQLETLSLPNTGMAVIIDIGTAGNIHPPDKKDVGLRLSLAARHVAYGEKLVYTGPMYDSMKADGDKIRISFKDDSVGGGLVIGTAPWTDPKDTPVSKTDLQGFSIAGADKKWVDAGAKIDGNTVVVSSSEVPNPVAVRYAWKDDPRCNLYNKEGLPASPFRTDDGK